MTCRMTGSNTRSASGSTKCGGKSSAGAVSRRRSGASRHRPRGFWRNWHNSAQHARGPRRRAKRPKSGPLGAGETYFGTIGTRHGGQGRIAERGARAGTTSPLDTLFTALASVSRWGRRWGSAKRAQQNAKNFKGLTGRIGGADGTGIGRSLDPKTLFFICSLVVRTVIRFKRDWPRAF